MNSLFDLIRNFEKKADFANEQTSFLDNLSFFLKKQIPIEDFDAFTTKNKSVIKDFFSNQYWEIGSELMMNFELKLIISKNPNEDLSDDIDVVDSQALLGHNSIPTLYLQSFRNINETGVEKVPASFSTYAFLAQALGTLFQLKFPQFEEEYFEFLKTHKAKIDLILKIGSKIPVMLGKGDDGIAFDMGNSFVLKIFKSKYVYEKALESIQRMHDKSKVSKTDIMIYDAGILGKFLNELVFYYVMERITPVTSFSVKMTNAIYFIVNIIIKHINNNKTKFTPLKTSFPNFSDNENKLIKSEIESLFNQIRKNNAGLLDFIEENTGSVKLNDIWLFTLIEEIFMKFLSSRTDLMMSNLGVTNYGEFRYFDPAHDLHKNNFNFKTDQVGEGFSREFESTVPRNS